MGTKVFDFLSFYYERMMKKNGYSVKRDSNSKIKVALRMSKDPAGPPQ